jgi:hypothetical protein
MDGYRTERLEQSKATKALKFVNTKLFPALVTAYVVGICAWSWLGDGHLVAGIAGILFFFAVRAFLKYAERRVTDFSRG